MAGRKLKTYQASIGFFDLVVAAPSMKAALEAWGSKSNLFHAGLASETEDPAIVAAALAKPGVVLKRPVGTTGDFTEHPKLPKTLDDEERPEEPPKPRPRTAPQQETAAVIAFEQEKRRRERERRLEEQRREKEHKRRAEAIAKAEAALERATARHDQIAQRIETEREALESNRCPQATALKSGVGA